MNSVRAIGQDTLEWLSRSNAFANIFSGRTCTKTYEITSPRAANVRNETAGLEEDELHCRNFTQLPRIGSMFFLQT